MVEQPGETPPPDLVEPGPEDGPSPEFQNPESPRYQPWAEKQITNAVKEKRPLQEFMAEFDSRVAAYGDIDSGSWDPQHQERLLAKFNPGRPRPVPSRRRRRHRSANSPPGAPSQAQGQIRNTRPGAAPLPATAAGGAPGERRRRRRRRPRGGRRPPEAPSGG